MATSCPIPNRDCTGKGISVDILNALESYLNFSTVYNLSEDGLWGTLPSNGTRWEDPIFDGVFQEVVEGRQDISASKGH